MKKKQRKKMPKSAISADEARRLCEVLNVLDCNPVRDDGSSVQRVYDYIAELILMKAGISIGRGDRLSRVLQDVRQKVLKGYGVSYVNCCDSSVWESFGVDEYDVRGALLLGTYLSRSCICDSFEEELQKARSYFEESADVDEDLFLDFMDEEYEDYEDEEDKAFDLGTNLAVDFIDAVCVCLKEGAEQVMETCIAPFYEVVCELDGVYEDNLELFIEHLPGLLIKVAEPYVSFDYQGNDSGECISGCLGQNYYLIEGAAAILPYLNEDSDDVNVRNLCSALGWLKGGLYTFSEYTERLRYHMARGEDICISMLCPEGESSSGVEPLPDFGELFAPLIWEALYPVVAARYLKEDCYEQAA